MATTVTFYDLLAGINAYPISPRTLSGIGATRGLDLEQVATTEGIASDAYRLSRADVLMWLSDAPDVSQGGQNYSFSDEQRARFRNEANAIYAELDTESKNTTYGYKGSRL